MSSNTLKPHNLFEYVDTHFLNAAQYAAEHLTSRYTTDQARSLIVALALIKSTQKESSNTKLPANWMVDAEVVALMNQGEPVYFCVLFSFMGKQLYASALGLHDEVTFLSTAIRYLRLESPRLSLQSVSADAIRQLQFRLRLTSPEQRVITETSQRIDDYLAGASRFGFYAISDIPIIRAEELDRTLQYFPSAHRAISFLAKDKMVLLRQGIAPRHIEAKFIINVGTSEPSSLQWPNQVSHGSNERPTLVKPSLCHITGGYLVHPSGGLMRLSMRDMHTRYQQINRALMATSGG